MTLPLADTFRRTIVLVPILALRPPGGIGNWEESEIVAISLGPTFWIEGGGFLPLPCPSPLRPLPVPFPCPPAPVPSPFSPPPERVSLPLDLAFGAGDDFVFIFGSGATTSLGLALGASGAAAPSSGLGSWVGSGVGSGSGDAVMVTVTIDPTSSTTSLVHFGASALARPKTAIMWTNPIMISVDHFGLRRFAKNPPCLGSTIVCSIAGCRALGECTDSSSDHSNGLS